MSERERRHAPSHDRDSDSDSDVATSTEIDAASARRSQRGASADVRRHLDANERKAQPTQATPDAALRTGSIGTMAAAFLAAGDFAGEMYLTQVRDRFGESTADRVRDVAFDGPAAVALAATEYAKPLSFAEAARAKPRARKGPVEPAPIEQSRPLDPAGQSFADPAADADQDGRADLPTHAPPAEAPADLAAVAYRAIDLLPQVAAHVARFADARDQLDPTAVREAGAIIARTLEAAAYVLTELRRDDPGSPQLASLTARLKATMAQATNEIGPHRFGGRDVMPGTAVHAAGIPLLAAQRLDAEAAHVADLVTLAASIRDTWIGASGLPTNEQQQQIGAQLAPLTARPIHLAFVKAALGSLGIWQHVASYQAPKAQRDPSTFGGIIGNATAKDRTVADLEVDAGRQAKQFGAMVDLQGFDQATAIELLEGNTSFTYLDDQHTEVSRSSKNAPQVLESMQHLDAAARTAVLAHFQRAGVLDLFAGGLPWRTVKNLDAEAGVGDVGRELGRYYQHRDTTDHSLSALAESVPVIGGALESTLNFATVGFLRSHDASYRAERQGLITDEQHASNTGDAAAVSAAVLALSTVGGTMGANALKGATGVALGEAATTTVTGRVVTAGAMGVGGGALGNVGARAATDLMSGDLSGLDTYLSDAGTGAAVGLALGGGLGVAGEAGSAIAQRLPPQVRARMVQLAERFPTIAPDGPIMQALADLSERAGAGAARGTATTGRAAGAATTRVVAKASEWIAAIEAGALKATPAIEAAITRAAGKVLAAGDRAAAGTLKAAGIDTDNLGGGGGMQPATVGGYGAAPTARDPYLAAELTAAGDHTATVLKAERLGDDFADDFGDDFADDIDPLTNHLGDSPETRAMHEIDPLGQEPHLRRLPVAKDIDPAVPPSKANSGHWADENAAGNTEWFSDNQLVNEVTGYKPVQFKDGYAVLDPYTLETVHLKKMVGSDADFVPCDIELARRKGWFKNNGEPNQRKAQKYREDNKLTWHHHQDRVRMQLVPYNLHNYIPHAGGASLARAQSTIP